jgi:hypothetical protein
MIKRLLSLALFFCGAFTFWSTWANEVVANLDESQKKISFTISSTSINPQEFAEGVLPWMEGGTNLTLIGVGLSNGKILRHLYPVADSWKQLTLEPKMSISGEMRLISALQDFERENRRQDILVFWSYELTSHNESPAVPRQGGWLLVPQKVPPKKRVIRGRSE